VSQACKKHEILDIMLVFAADKKFYQFLEVFELVGGRKVTLDQSVHLNQIFIM
jgi:hypothetical protein